MASSSVPVVDLSKTEEVIIDGLHSAFTDVGFVFLVNHSIDRKSVEEVFEIARSFFALPVEVKSKYTRSDKTRNNGYVALEVEKVDPKGPVGDYKEAYDLNGRYTQQWPCNQDIPSFKPTMEKFYQSCNDLTLKLLQWMGMALKLEDPSYFVKAHKSVYDDTKNCTTFRLLHYPSIPSSTSIKEGQLRCGEHSDYGSKTLLFQDSLGGLQVKRTDGQYIDAPIIEDSVIVNLGLVMARWTSDFYRATPHRVIVPKDDVLRKRERLSIVFFSQPDNDTVIQCVHGSNKYQPITASDHLQELFLQSYGYGL